MSLMERIGESYWFRNISYRTLITTTIASLLFFSGWWLVIDTASVYPKSLDFSHYVCGILATISFIIVNSISNERLTSGILYEGGVLGEGGFKKLLFVGFVLGFTSIIAAVWIMLADFTLNESRTDKYPGYALLIQNIFIFSATIIYKFGPVNDDDGYLPSQ